MWGRRPMAARKQWATRLPLVCGLVIAGHVGHASALEPPHDVSNGIECSDCHAAHATGPSYGLFPRGAEQEAMCKTCHNPTGQASSMHRVTSHSVDSGTRLIDCGSCHNPHRPSTSDDAHAGGTIAANLRLVRDDMRKYVPQALQPAVFQRRPDQYAFATGEPPYNGVCQACHVNTRNHTNDGAGNNSHNVGMSCVACHPHEDGFLPTGGCTQCHNQPQGGRRQIVDAGGDFMRASHHLAGVTPVDEDCTACHDVSAHGGGTVRLLDPDLGAALVRSYDPANPKSMDGFCLACHDDNGAQALAVAMQPFSDGQSPPDVKLGTTWAVSAHGSIGYAPNGGAPIGCLGDGSSNGCHGNAHGTDSPKLLAAAAPTTIDQFCFKCHTDGLIVNKALSGGVNDIQEAFGQSRKHDMGATFTVGTNTYELQCTTCHNPHVVTGKHADVAANTTITPITRPDLTADPTSNPRAMGTMLWGDAPGEKMNDFAARGAGTGGWYNSVARGGQLVFDQPGRYQPMKREGWDGATNRVYEAGGDALPDYATFCLDCHSYRMSAANPPVNWGQGGVACTGNSVDPPNQRVACNAPHGLGSANMPSYWGDVGMFGNSGNQDPIFGVSGVTRGRGAGHFMRWPFDSVHKNAGANFVMSCTDCHEAHGSPIGSMLRTTVNSGPGTTVWNNMCNNCHFYYGGQHAGMSCGNASCHEANSIHRIVKNGEYSGGVSLWTEPSRPVTTPEIAAVLGVVGSRDLAVSFTVGVWTNGGRDPVATLSGALEPGDFLLTDVGGDNPRGISSVTHTPGDAFATVTMSQPLGAADLFTDLLATRGITVWDAEGDPAGPWPLTVGGTCPVGKVVFPLDEAAGSSYAYDQTGQLRGPVGAPSVSFQGDGDFHGDPAQATWVDYDSNITCLKQASTITVEALVRTNDVDKDYDGPGDQWPLVDATFSRVFERKRSIKITILHADYRGDNIDARANKASIEVKYFVQDASRHTCPHAAWPADPYTGDDSRWHQVSTDIDTYPIVSNHWYQIRVVYNSDKTGIVGSNGIPVDIFVDDLGTDGLGAGELWTGYLNTAQPNIEDSSSCKWGAQPGDLIALEDQAVHIGAPPNHNATYIFDGLISWVTWEPVADYGGVNSLPN